MGGTACSGLGFAAGTRFRRSLWDCEVFAPEKGFGFIESEGKDYFVHFTGIDGTGFRSLGDGEEVEFDIEVEASSGKERAVRVTGPGGAPVKGSQREQQEY